MSFEIFCNFAGKPFRIFRDNFPAIHVTIVRIPDIIIAIDGYSSTGKSSFAKRIAKEAGFTYLDSGALYRGVTLYAVEHGLIGEDNTIDEPGLSHALQSLDLHFETGSGKLFMEDRCIENEIRTLAISKKVSPVSALPPVREFVDRKLRELGGKKKVVIDGRDIGSTVFPDAELKIFMTAAPEVRAMRRMKEMQAKGEDVRFEDVLENVRERDYLDSHRKISPLTRPADAVVLNNSEMTPDEQMVWIKSLIDGKFGTCTKLSETK